VGSRVELFSSQIERNNRSQSVLVVKTAGCLSAGCDLRVDAFSEPILEKTSEILQALLFRLGHSGLNSVYLCWIFSAPKGILWELAV